MIVRSIRDRVHLTPSLKDHAADWREVCVREDIQVQWSSFNESNLSTGRSPFPMKTSHSRGYECCNSTATELRRS